VSTPQDAARLVWNEHCTASLPKYLIGIKDKVGIVTKGCDGRAIVELIKDKQVDRDKVVIIAPVCLGVKRALGTSKEEVLADYCERCSDRTSPISDILIPGSPSEKGAAQRSTSDAKAGKPSKRGTPWMEEFQRCTKCLACIRACPLCYCTECELDGSMPSLVSKLRIPSELSTFHLVRAMHMAGRCVGCGACEAACPVDIPLTDLYSRVNEEVERILGYVPGIDVNSTPPVELPRPKVEKK
jgi:ferredoxin